MIKLHMLHENDKLVSWKEGIFVNKPVENSFITKHKLKDWK